MRALRLALLAVLTALLGTGRAFGAFENLGAGARAPGMGDAFTALADDAYAVYYNPAGLAQLERPQFSASYTRLYLGLSDNSDLSTSQFTYAKPWHDGKKGTFGFGFQQFGLGSLYNERSLYFSYGHVMKKKKNGGRWLWGMNFKYLTRSIGPSPEANNSCLNGQCDQGPDPVLHAKGKGVVDADLGFIYRFPRHFQWGLLAQHLTSPDVGFQGSDKLKMNIHTGLAYKTLWMNLAAEVKQEPNPLGASDRDIILAAERFFPSLDYGQFGLRGSLGFGSRDWKQITTGLSYRINKIQIDYAFMIPIGTVSGTQGTHRVALTFHFGAPTAEEEISEALYDQARQLREGKGPGYGYEFAQELRPHEITDPRLARVRQLINSRQYRRAHEALVQWAKDLPPEASLVRLANRLELTSYYYPEYPNPRQRWEKLLISAINQFLEGHDRKAILQASYALNLSLNDSKLDHYLAKMEEGVGIKAERLAADNPRGFIEEMLYRVESANNRGEYDKVQAQLKDILDMEPDNATALERVGSTYFILQRYQEAIDAWQQAIPLEKRAEELASLNDYIRQSQQKLGQPVTPLPAPGMAPPPEVPAPAAAPARPAPAVAPVQRADVRDVERLYQKGVEHYARGEYLQATAMFMRILQIDPNNAQARKALDRIQRNSPAGGGPAGP